MYFALLALFRSYFIVFPPEGSHVFGLGTLELEGHQKNVQTTARFILDQVVAPVPHRHYSAVNSIGHTEERMVLLRHDEN